MARIQRPGETATTPARGSLTGNNKTKKRKPSRPKSKPAASSTSEETQASGRYNEDNVTSGGAGAYDPNSNYGRGDLGTYEEWLSNQGMRKGKMNANKQARMREQYDEQAASNGAYPTTEEGRMYAQASPEDYFSYLMGEAGGMSTANPIYGGQSRFGNWLATEHQSQVLDAYTAAQTASGGELNIVDYMNSIGYGANANKNALLQPNAQLSQPGTAQLPGDTGNPFTSSSIPAAPGSAAAAAPAAAPPTWDSFLGDKGVNKFGKLNKGRKDRLRDAYSDINTPNPLTGGAPTGAPGAPTGNDAAGGIDAARLKYMSLTPQQRGTNGATSIKPGRWSIF